MTSDTRDLTITEQPPNRPDRVQLSAVQVAASALASVSAAVVASLFGVTGTVVGAGLVAILSTTGSAIYSTSMKRTTNQLRRAREQLLTVRTGESRTVGRPTTRSRGTNRTIDLTDGADTAAQARTVRPSTALQPSEPQQSRWRRGWLTVGSRRGLKWPALIGAALLVFAIAIGAITAFEAITQKPISSLTGHSSSSSTTIGSLTGNSKATPTPTPSATPTNGGSDTSTTTPSAQPSTKSSNRSGTQTKVPASASPRPSASVAPSSAAPQPSKGSGTGGTSQDIQVPAP